MRRCPCYPEVGLTEALFKSFLSEAEVLTHYWRVRDEIRAFIERALSAFRSSSALPWRCSSASLRLSSRRDRIPREILGRVWWPISSAGEPSPFRGLPVASGRKSWGRSSAGRLEVSRGKCLRGIRGRRRARLRPSGLEPCTSSLMSQPLVTRLPSPLRLSESSSPEGLLVRTSPSTAIRQCAIDDHCGNRANT